MLSANDNSPFANPSSTSSPLWTVREVAEALRVSPSLVYRLVETGKLPCFRIGRGAIRISQHDLQQFLASSQRTPAPKEEQTKRPTLRHLKL